MPVIQNHVGLTLDEVVVATDFTPESEKALAYGRAFAHQFGSKLTLAHVVDLSVSSRYPANVVGLPLDEMRCDSAENLDRALNKLGIEGIIARSQSVEALNPADAIVELSEKMDSDLVIIGTHDRQGLSKLILGSCSEGVIHTARCPVLTIGPKASPHPIDVAFHSIVFATDLKHNAAEKAAVALAFAKDSIADVHICHVIENHLDSSAQAVQEHTRVEQALSKLIPDASYTWTNPKPSVLFGNVDQQILKVAANTNADLIVLGAHRGARCANHLWCGVVESVIREAHCPVLTICT